MTLNVCAWCTTKFSIGAAHCPQCGNADYYEEGSMAKISRSAGATHLGDPPRAVPSPVDLTEPPAVAEAVEFPDEAGPVVSEYDTWLPPALRSECEKRGLPKTGNKPELVARLVASDSDQEVADVVGAVPVDSPGSGTVAPGGPEPSTEGLPE